MIENYLLDTNAVRGIGLRGFKKLYGQGHVEIYSSPFNFWEILSHLEEDFQCFKRHLLKFKYTKVLDDPKRTTQLVLFPRESGRVNKVPDHQIIQRVLKKLEGSASLGAFYSKYIKDPKGTRKISDCSLKVKKELRRRENAFKQKGVGTFLRKLYSKKIPVPEEEDYKTFDYLIRDRPERGETTTYGEKTQEINKQVYLFTSYTLQLAIKYFKSGNKVRHISRNDFEDAIITLHLNLDSDKRLISSDENVINFIEKTRNILTHVKITPAFGIQDLESFRNHFQV